MLSLRLLVVCITSGVYKYCDSPAERLPVWLLWREEAADCEARTGGALSVEDDDDDGARCSRNCVNKVATCKLQCVIALHCSLLYRHAGADRLLLSPPWW